MSAPKVFRPLRRFFKRVVIETLEFVRREMTHPEGGFYSSLDADSQGEEGRFYVWTRAEILDVLGEEDGELFAAAYGVTEAGNFTEEASGEYVPCERGLAAGETVVTSGAIELLGLL